MISREGLPDLTMTPPAATRRYPTKIHGTGRSGVESVVQFTTFVTVLDGSLMTLAVL